MRAASVIGRVGGLAVALGVGAAAATGVAWADDTTSPSQKSSQSAEQRRASTTETSKRAGSLDVGRAIRRALNKVEGKASERGAPLRTRGVPETADTEETTGQDPVTPAEQPAEAPAPTPAAKPARIKTPAVQNSLTSKPSRKFDLTSARAALSQGSAKAAEPVRAAARVATPAIERASQQASAGAAKLAADVATNPISDSVAAVLRQAPAVTTQFTQLSEPTPIAKIVAPDQPAADIAPPAVLQSVARGVLAAFGFSPRAANSPVLPTEPVPTEPAALVALLAWGTRREFDQSATVNKTAAPVALVATPAAAAVTAPATTRIGWLTGANSLNDTVRRFGIAGTDVGVMWDNGITTDNPATAIVERREILMAFGDTFSGPAMTGTWRMNTLLRSPDQVLSDGLYVPDGIIHDPGAYSGSPMTYQNFSREIIGNYHYGTSNEVTMIPTAGVSVAGAGVNGATRQYIQFMAVKSWDTPGRWTTNYSAIAYSDDNGQNWTVVPASSVRAAAPGSATVPYVSGNQNFQQGAFVKPPAGSPEAAAGWVYSYGTPAGRNGTAYVSRVNEKDILDQTKYQYWNGSTWVANKPSAATPILPGTTTTSWFGLVKRTTYPTVGEMSVQYNPYVKKYVMLYTDSNNNVIMRTSSTPQGGWSAPTTLATSAQYPGLYAPMIHPWSGTDQLKKADGTPEDPQYLYWGLSQWNEYNVALMRTDLSRV